MINSDVTLYSHWKDVRAAMVPFYKQCYNVIFPQDGCEEGTVLLLVGNKTDLSEEDEQRVVKTKDGAKLADVSSIGKWHTL